jgi:hypothetical protein
VRPPPLPPIALNIGLARSKKTTPPRKQPPFLKANAVLAIADRPDPPDNPVSTDTTAWTDSLANPAIAVPQPDQLPNWCPKPLSNARAKLHQETVALQDPKETTDHPETEVHQAPTENQETKDHVDHPDHPDQLAPTATKDLQAKLVNSPDPNPDHQETLVPTANPVQLARPARLVKLVKTAPQAPLARKETLVLPVDPARLALPAVPAIPAKMAHLAAANTAHLLVWLQVIKRLQRLVTVISGQFQSDHTKIAKNMFNFQDSIGSPSHTFHVILI